MPEDLPADRVSGEVSPEELRHPESLAVHVGPVPAAEGGLWSPARRPLTLGLVLTITLVAAEALAVTTAMPIVARDLGGLEHFGLVFSAFFIGSLFGIVVVAGLIDRVGVVPPFLVGLGLFAVGLALAGSAPSMEVVIGARFIQGVGGGAIPPVAYVAIGRSLPEHLRPRMFAMLSTAWILPGVFGPAIAGFVAETFHWRYVFLGLLPLIVVSGSMAYRGLRALPSGHALAPGAVSLWRRIGDATILALGVVLLTAGLTSETPAILIGGAATGLVITVLSLQRLTPPGTLRARRGYPSAVLLRGVLTSETPAILIGGAATGLVITVLSLQRLTPPGTLRARRGYPSAVLLRGVLTFAFFCVDAYVALLLVEVRGWSATAAGVALTAATISWTAGSWTQARLSHRIRAERFVQLGFPVVAVFIGALGLVTLPAVPAWLAIPIFAAAGFGMGLTYSQFAIIVLRDAPPAIVGTVTAGLTLSDVIGTALGTGVSAAAVAASVRAGLGPGPGIAVAVVIGTVVAGLGFVLAPRLRTTVR